MKNNRIKLSAAFGMIAVGFSFFSITDEGWLTAMPLVAALLLSGWITENLLDICIIAASTGLLYVLMLLLTGQVTGARDPTDGSTSLVALYGAMTVALSLVPLLAGYFARKRIHA